MALPTQLTLEVVTPERPLVREMVDEVTLPGTLGELGILPGHAPLLTTLKVGELTYRKGQERTVLAMAFGFAEILPDRVIVLARLAERAEEIDVERAKAALERAQEQLASRAGDMDLERARIAMLKSLARVRAAERARMRR
jgi:F-type H+-transporting ATPase subunit epsilon